MKKLRLELDELTVDTFATSRDTGTGRGTVLGQAMPAPDTRYLWQCGDSSFDAYLCYTGNPKYLTCQLVYTCPDCMTQPETHESCDTVDVC